MISSARHFQNPSYNHVRRKCTRPPGSTFLSGNGCWAIAQRTSYRGCWRQLIAPRDADAISCAGDAARQHRAARRYPALRSVSSSYVRRGLAASCLPPDCLFLATFPRICRSAGLGDRCALGIDLSVCLPPAEAQAGTCLARAGWLITGIIELFGAGAPGAPPRSGRCSMKNTQVF